MEDCQTQRQKSRTLRFAISMTSMETALEKLSFAGNHCQMDSLSWLSMYGLSTAKMKF